MIFQKLGQLTIEEEQQNQSNVGNENESDNIAYNDGDNSENPWKKGTQASAQQETATPTASSSKPGIYVAPRGDVRNIKKTSFVYNSLYCFTITIADF